MQTVSWKSTFRNDSIKNCIIFCDFHHESEFRRNLRYICNNANLTKYSKPSIFAWDYYSQNPFLTF